MKAKFYDVKEKKSVEAEVVEKKVYDFRGGHRYAVFGKTADGRKLTLFVSKAIYDSAC